MGKLSVSVDVPLQPEKAWECASELSRYKEWLSNGDGRGGVKVKLIGEVNSSREDPAGSTFSLDVHLGGPALFGPIGMVIAASLKGDIRESLDKFKSVFAPA
jgi:hypothetical protein